MIRVVKAVIGVAFAVLSVAASVKTLQKELAAYREESRGGSKKSR